jgi:hypothetical protein
VKTRTELIHRTLRNLGALPQGQSPNAEDSQSIDDLIDPVVADLRKRNIVVVASTAIEDQYFIPLGHIMAAAASEEFGSHNDVGIQAHKAKAEVDLIAMQRGKVASST